MGGWSPNAVNQFPSGYNHTGIVITKNNVTTKNVNKVPHVKMLKPLSFFRAAGRAQVLLYTEASLKAILEMEGNKLSLLAYNTQDDL